jgi:hypothetical protein
MEEPSKYKLRKIVLQAYVTSAKRRKQNTRITGIVLPQQGSKGLKVATVKVKVMARAMVNPWY